MILSGCCCFWFLGSRRGWAGLLGVLGGDLIVPATTPVPRLTSLGDLYRSCRSNQSLPDCSHLTVVIRASPICYCEVFRLRDTLSEFESYSFHQPCPPSVSSRIHLVHPPPSDYLPARPADNSKLQLSQDPLLLLRAHLD